MNFITINDLEKYKKWTSRAWLKIRGDTIYVNVKARAIIGGDLWRIESSIYSLAIDFKNNILMLERVEKGGFKFTTQNRLKVTGLGQFLYDLGYCVGADHPYKYIGRKEYGWMFRMTRRKRLKMKWRKKKRKSTVNMEYERRKKEEL